MVFDFIDPFLDVLESLLFRDVVNEKSTETLAIMSGGDGLESLLSG